MKYKEFLEYLQNNLAGYKVFMEKATVYQNEKNKNRTAKKRWDGEKVKRAAYEMWKKSMQPLYDTIKNGAKSDSSFAWMEFIKKNNVLESVNDGISELDFNE